MRERCLHCSAVLSKYSLKEMVKHYDNLEGIYSFCESVHATSTSPWHLRKMTSEGKKLGGGIDTPSLCGLIKQGWDLQVGLTEHHIKHACPKCREIYEEEARDEQQG